MSTTPIAHRGLWWPNRQTENSIEAIADAFAAGYGIEIDVRESLHDASQLILSHDVPVESQSYPTLAQFVEVAIQHPLRPILVDAKEPRCAEALVGYLASAQLLGRAWLFDFELEPLPPGDPLDRTRPYGTTMAEWLAESGSGARLLARVSDKAGTGLLPTDPTCAAPWADGVWLDPWDTDVWVTRELIAAWKQRGPVFIAAPDLHGRLFDFRLLEEWHEADGICTDIPQLVGPVLAGDPPVHPCRPWWGA